MKKKKYTLRKLTESEVFDGFTYGLIDPEGNAVISWKDSVEIEYMIGKSMNFVIGSAVDHGIKDAVIVIDLRWFCYKPVEIFGYK